MPKVKLSKTFINNLKTSKKTIDYFDTEIKGLLLRSYPSGTLTYQLYYRNASGVQKRYTIAKHGKITLMQAREISSQKLSAIYSGSDIQQNKIDTRNTLTLGEYLEQFYYTWFKQHRKGDRSTINILKNTLSCYHAKNLDTLDNKLLNDFIASYCKKHSVSNARINRIVTAIKAAMTIAVEYQFITTNKLKGFKMLHEDKHRIVRYLSPDEEKRLLNMADNIDPLYKSIVHLALNTGMRAGEILSLEWQDINSEQKYIALKSENTKAQKTRYIPLNNKALNALKTVQKHKTSEYVFTNPKTKTKYSKYQAWFCKLLDQASIKNFRFHDLRHSFASKLVMKGVDLNTVRELMGHSDIKMTLVYAHLAPEHKQKAVDLL